MEGFMLGTSLLSYLPLHKLALVRSKGLLGYIQSWWLEDKELK